MLPSTQKYKDCFEDHFIFYEPKEKVSGDFHWMHQSGREVYFCVADCTGHGVPGALVSVVGANALNTCIKEKKMTQPSEILDKMSLIVGETLTSEEHNMQDGMDISLCKLNLDTLELTYSGANNPIYILNINGLQILTPNKQPVGNYEFKKPFTQESISLKSGDCLYLFSDGYADQFGGPSGKKFMYKKLRNLLENNVNLSMSEQKNNLYNSFIDWKGSHEQVDDVCIIGVRL